MLKKSIEAHKEIQGMVLNTKYQANTMEELFERVTKSFEENCPLTLSKFKDNVIESLKEQTLLPAGSILSSWGVEEHKRPKNQSLSNCYFTPIKEDSLEGIFDALREMARTYSYRGGTGTDITILRPAGNAVNNAAKVSSGAVSFMPLISAVTNTIGQSSNAKVGNGGEKQVYSRRGAAIITLDIRHPDIPAFIKAKSDPEEVFGKDPITGRVPDIFGANLSIKVSDSFMKAVEEDSMWEFIYPDMYEYNGEVSEKYKNNWNGNYDEWKRIGGKLITYAIVPARDVLKMITEASHKCGDPGITFWDHVVDHTPGTYLSTKLKPAGLNPCFPGDVKVLTINGPVSFHELAEKGEDVDVLSMDPQGLLRYYPMRNPRCTWGNQELHQVNFEDRASIRSTPTHGIYTTIKDKVEAQKLQAEDCVVSNNPKIMEKVVSTTLLKEKEDVYNGIVDDVHRFFVEIAPERYILVANCGEQPLANYNNCLLTAIPLHKFVEDPYTDKAVFNQDKFLKAVQAAVVFLNVAQKYNQERHPLQEQREADAFGRRIGVEITGLADMLAMLNLPYGSEEALEHLQNILQIKSRIEVCTSLDIVKADKSYLPGVYSDWRNTKILLQYFLDSPYMENLNLEKHIKEEILEYGLANTAFNTVGPCGTISILSDNCTSGIEPPFAISYKRRTVTGDGEFDLTHLPILLAVQDNPDLSVEECISKYTEASDISLQARIETQSIIQRYTDASISSTINLPEDTTPETIGEIYELAHKYNLKGITVFRDGCKKAVYEKTHSKSASPQQETTANQQATPTTVATKVVSNVVLSLNDVENSVRHRVVWKGSKLYVSVSIDDDGKPLEVFAKLPRSAGDEDGIFDPTTFSERTSNWDAVCRLASLLLRMGVPVEEIINQLDKSSYSIVDAASILVRVLNKYRTSLLEEYTEEEVCLQELGEHCPACGKAGVIFENGCSKCLYCGDSSCG